MQSANEKFGMRVRELREHKRLGQEQLGKQLGVKKQTVSNWERGVTQPSRRMRIRILKLLGSNQLPIWPQKGTASKKSS
jgi:transcriptional regulator with XRE-family HTH domain